MKKILAVLILSSSLSFAQLPSIGTTWEMQPTTGVDTNGGCFIDGSTGTNLTYPTSSPVAYTDLVAVTTTTITSAGHPFSSTSPGNCLHIASGTGWTTGWFYCVSVSSVTCTVDRAIATMGSTGGTGTFGGALKTFGQLNTNMTGGHQAWVKAEATISAGASVVWGFTSLGSSINGYTSTRGDYGRVTVQATATGYTIFNVAVGNNAFIVRNFIFDCNSKATCSGITVTNAFQELDNIVVTNFTTNGFLINNIGVTCHWCYATGGVTGGTAAWNNGNQTGVTCQFCFMLSNAVPGFSSNALICTFCVSANNTGTTSDGFIFGAIQSSTICDHCVAYGNGRDGFRFATSANPAMSITNSISVNNAVSATGYGLNSVTQVIAQTRATLDYNAFFGSTASYNQVAAGPHDIALSASPFTNGAGNDFTLNNTAGAGAAVRSISYPTVPYIGGTSNSQDIGALQHAGTTPVTVGFPLQ